MNRYAKRWAMLLIATSLCLPRLAMGQVEGPAFRGTNAAMDNYFLGKTGIGTNAPGKQFHVVGDSHMQGALTVDGAFQLPAAGDIGMGFYTNGVNDQGIVASNLALRGAWISYDGTDQGLYVSSNGNVGIGSSTPSAALQVNGTGILSHATVTSGLTLGGVTRTTWPNDISQGAFDGVSNTAAGAFGRAIYASNGLGGDVVVLTNGQDLGAAIDANYRSNATYLLPEGIVTLNGYPCMPVGSRLVGRGIDRSVIVGGGVVYFSRAGPFVTNWVANLTYSADGWTLYPGDQAHVTNYIVMDSVRTTSSGAPGGFGSWGMAAYTLRNCRIDNPTDFMKSANMVSQYELLNTIVGATNYIAAKYQRYGSGAPTEVAGYTNYLRVMDVKVDASLTLGGETRTNWPTDAAAASVASWASNTAVYGSNTAAGVSNTLLNSLGGDVVILTNGQSLSTAWASNNRPNVTFILPAGTVTLDATVVLKPGARVIGQGRDVSFVTGGSAMGTSVTNVAPPTNWFRGFTYGSTTTAGHFAPMGTTSSSNITFLTDIRTWSTGVCYYPVSSFKPTYYFKDCIIETTNNFMRSGGSGTNRYELINTTFWGTNYLYAKFRKTGASAPVEEPVSNSLRVAEALVDSTIRMGTISTNPPTYSGGPQLWGQSSNGTNELFVMDGAGNITQLSTHEELKHIARSWNIFTGEGRVIDLDAMAEAVQKLTGRTDIRRTVTYPRVDWDQMEQEKVKAREAEIAACEAAAQEAGEGVGQPPPPPYVPVPKPAWLVEWEKYQKGN